ncbi:MAG TPA: cysteine desulfurase family protein [Bacilli bacterium]|nr:cysteine desulfurase family protein [Bacilli bacterium]
MIYLDNAATTKPRRELLDIFQKIEGEFFANANSDHQAGREAEKYVAKARSIILDALGVMETHRVVFCSSATEANNLALKGFVFKHKKRGDHLIISNIEHPSVMECACQLRDAFGYDLTILNVNHKGFVRPEDVRQALTKNTILVSVMAVNNEIGSINPISEIADIVHRHSRAVLHVDASQAVGKISLPYSDIDLLSISGHKINGLKGSGALLIGKNIELIPLLSGGGQEYGLRSSTISPALAYTLALAVKEAVADEKKHGRFISSLNSLLRSYFLKKENIVVNSPEKASSHILNVSLTDKKASVVVEALSNQGIMISSVSACHAKAASMSYSVRALGRSEDLSKNTLRISFDYQTTMEDIEVFIQALDDVLERIRS